jgi:5-methylcytosine-specific restriction endonuclease McrA
MQRSGYGDCLSVYGWEIDHIMPIERGGSDDLANKQPLQWQNNRTKGDKVFPLVNPFSW